MYKTDLYIAGKWTPATNTGEIPVYNPATEQMITGVANADISDAIKAIDAADNASKDWAKTPPRVRGEILRKCWQLMIENKEKITEYIMLENGKSRADAESEAIYSAEFFRWFSEQSVRIHGDNTIAPSGANRIVVSHEPIGISLLITPWNYPAAMATRKIAPALAAGCTVVLKPATETPLTAYLMADILAQAGVPAGVVNVITTANTADVINAMMDDNRVKKVSFTGSTAVGSRLLAKASERIVSPAMELGGNAPFIVFEDADIEKALAGLMLAKMRNGGSACTAANRIFVHDSIYDTFVAKFTEQMQGVKMGNPLDAGVTLGPLVNQKTADKIAELVDDAIANGAVVHCGGKAYTDTGSFYPPTVLSNVSDKAKIAVEEIFGPVAVFYKFTDQDDVIKRANDTPYGLISYLYTEDFRRGLRVSEQLQAGMIGLNRGIASDPAAPFGGVKESGLGREGADHGMLEFMETKYIATEW